MPDSNKRGRPTTNEPPTIMGDTLAPKPLGYIWLVLQNIGGNDMTMTGLIKLTAIRFFVT